MSSNTDAVVCVEKLRFSYQIEEVLHGLSFEVRRAELFGIVGPNGSGKSTLCGVLSTILTPSSGEVSVLGHLVRSSSQEVRRHIGVTFQSPSLDRRLTVLENLRCQAAIYGLNSKSARDRISHLCRQFEIDEYANSIVATLSGGMRRRTEVAKCLLHRPRLLLLDEPSTGVDPIGRNQFWRLINTLRATEDVTVIVTTHLMDEAENCDRLLFLNDGVIAAIDTPSEIRQRVPGQILNITSNTSAEVATALDAYSGVTVERDGSRIVVRGNNLYRVASEILQRFDGRIESIAVNPCGLGDCFYYLTGRSLAS